MESKADQIAELLLKGGLTKAQIARAVGANYSQVHLKERELLSKGTLKNHAPLGKKGKVASASKAVARPAPTPKSKVVKAAPKAAVRPAGTPTERKTPTQAKIDEMILHMTAVIEQPSAVDLITAATDAVPESVKDSMTSEDLNVMIRSRIKALLASGELHQSSSGIFSTSNEQEEIDDSEIDNDDVDDLRKRREDDAVFGGEDDDESWLSDMLSNGRRTGGYHL